jgi:ketosteroid isomerase-like protein
MKEDDELKKIKAIFNELIPKYETAIKSKNLDLVRKYWSDDAYFLASGAPKIKGWNNIEGVFTQFVKDLVEWNYIMEDIYLLSESSIVLTGKIKDSHEDSGESVVNSVSYWEKQSNDDWKITTAIAQNLD